ncbi:hypothetical protein [Thalassolituus pacificus]|uniref:Uncharacterized protein n=1 Tax=Thalassolituus pacificus TaxID=2975440 RepID=A0A9X2WCQ1_9GAMM|nr:hypothetical protein [Thalassolituus pacificus]MCT7357999.1 hypothetical protein [Thalassolituus pacificus]
MAILIDHTKRNHAAIKILIEEKHHESALILIYAWIDRMAWLSVSDEASGADFKAWVNTYLLPNSSLGCSADDLWAARCAVLHTSTSYARDTKSGKAKRIQYVCNDAISVSNIPSDTIFIYMIKLYQDAIGAVDKFDHYLESNDRQRQIAEKKLSMFFQLQELSNEQTV